MSLYVFACSKDFLIISNKFAYILSRPIVNAFVILKNNSIMNESYIKQYTQDEYFKYVYATLSQGNHVEELDYHVHNKLWYDLGNFCIPWDERVNVIR